MTNRPPFDPTDDSPIDVDDYETSIEITDERTGRKYPFDAEQWEATGEF